MYIGYVLDYNKDTKTALIEQRNYFEVGDSVEFFGPNLENARTKINNIVDFETKEELTVARHPLQKLLINIDVDIKQHDMMRKVK